LSGRLTVAHLTTSLCLVFDKDSDDVFWLCLPGAGASNADSRLLSSPVTMSLQAVTDLVSCCHSSNDDDAVLDITWTVTNWHTEVYQETGYSTL